MEKHKNKIDDMTNEDIKLKLYLVRNDIQFLGEQLDRKRSWRDRLIRECWKRGIFKPRNKNEGQSDQVIVGFESVEPSVGD